MRNLLYKPTTVRYNLLNDVDAFINDHFYPEEPASPFKEKEENYIAAFSLPGVKKSAVKVSVLENSIHITAKSEEEAAFPVDFQHSYPVPEEADLDQLSASLKDGVLTLTLPKVEPVEIPERVIKIK